MTPPPLSLYVHLPWCVRKCPYCDFNSHTAGENPPLGRYVDALLLDLERQAPLANGRVVETVFLGGGTPSLFPPREIGRLLAGLGGAFAVADDVEVTLEANPGTVDCGAPAGYRAAGVNRLSIGAQSFDDAALRRLGRIHAAADIRRACAAAQAAGFDDVNLDVMHGLPGQSAAAARDDIRAALDLGPTHLSWYQLTLEPNTVLYARPPADLPEEDELARIQDEGAALLREAGFEQYEVSAWARHGRRCRHNMNYWTFGDYLSVGAGAHGKLTKQDCIYRYRRPAHPQQYMNDVEAGKPVALEPVADPLLEFMINALRLPEGFREAEFTARTGLSGDDLEVAMQGPLAKGLVERGVPGTWRASTLGWRFLNDLQAEFLRET